MTFNTASFAVQVAALLIVLAALHKPLGALPGPGFRRHHVQSGPSACSTGWPGSTPARSRPGRCTCAACWRSRLSPSWPCSRLQRLQGVLPGSGSLPGVDSWVAMNTAISFVTNTNWQTYVPEATVGIFVQMCLLAVQNFLSAAVGIVVVVALIRGIARTEDAAAGQLLGGPGPDVVPGPAADRVRRRRGDGPGRGGAELLAHRRHQPGGGNQPEHPRRAGRVPGSHQGARHQRRRLLQRQLRPPVREPQRPRSASSRSSCSCSSPRLCPTPSAGWWATRSRATPWPR